MSIMIKEKKPKNAWKKIILILLEEGIETAIKEGRKRLYENNIIVELEEPQEINELINLLQKQEMWLYPSQEELKELILNEKGARSYEYSYGRRIFDFNGFNQIDNYVIPLMQKNPNTTQAIINLWDPAKDSKVDVRDKVSFHSVFFSINNNNENNNNKDNNKNIDNKNYNNNNDYNLDLTMIFRSTDFTVGWPANIFQGVTLMNYVCKKLNLKPGKITTISINGHIYSDNANIIKRELLD